MQCLSPPQIENCKSYNAQGSECFEAADALFALVAEHFAEPGNLSYRDVETFSPFPLVKYAYPFQRHCRWRRSAGYNIIRIIAFTRYSLFRGRRFRFLRKKANKSNLYVAGSEVPVAGF